MGAVRPRKFRNPDLRATYDWFRENAPAPDTKSKGSAHNAYYVGRYHPGRPSLCVRGSHAYAAWAAGIDNFTAAGKPA